MLESEMVNVYQPLISQNANVDHVTSSRYLSRDCYLIHST